MSNLTHTVVDLGAVEVRDGEFRDDTLTISGETTFKAGTILARDSSTLLLVPFVKNGNNNENGIPKAVLTYEVTGSANKAVRVLVGGTVNKDRLVIHADGDDENVDAAVIDQLRSFAIIPVDVDDLGRQDNPQPEAAES